MLFSKPTPPLRPVYLYPPCYNTGRLDFAITLLTNIRWAFRHYSACHCFMKPRSTIPVMTDIRIGTGNFTELFMRASSRSHVTLRQSRRSTCGRIFYLRARRLCDSWILGEVKSSGNSLRQDLLEGSLRWILLIAGDVAFDLNSILLTLHVSTFLQPCPRSTGCLPLSLRVSKRLFIAYVE